MQNTYRFENAPFVLSGQRIKAGFHCHSLNSDGGLPPEETAKKYYEKGFQCLGITDHGMVTRAESPAGGEMLLTGSSENGGQPDIIGIGIKEPVDKDIPLRERARMLAAQGGFTIAAHPAYCAALPETYCECPDLMAMEIYNAYCDAAYANGYALELWDMVLGMGKRIWGVAGDDAHLNPRKRHYSDAGLGWVEVWQESLEEKSILTSLKKGEFFSTQGPVFKQIAAGENGISLKCSPVKQVRWRTFGSVGHVEYTEENSSITEASLPEWFVPSKYVRIELVDHAGKRAWSNPFFVISD